MKKATMNKNVMHDGKHYAKGMHLKPDMPGFKSLIEAGHCDVVSMDEDDAALSEGQAPEAPAEEHAHGKKHGRK